MSRIIYTYHESGKGRVRKTWRDGQLIAVHIWRCGYWRDPIELLTKRGLK